MNDPERLVFVAGLHRSGTTPLARALAAHPQVSGLTDTGVKEDEGQHLQDVYPKAKVYGGAGRFAMAPGAHLTEASDLLSPESARRLWDAWQPYWDMSRPVLVEKSPPNLIMGRFLQALFPGSALVVVVRHPVVVSLSTHKWRRLASPHWRNHTSLVQLTEHWLRAHQLLVHDLPQLKRVHIVRYEELVMNPDVELSKIGRFLGLEGPVPATDLHASHSTRYQATWESMRRGGWLQRSRRRGMIERYNDTVAAFGYDMADLDRLTPIGL